MALFSWPGIGKKRIGFIRTINNDEKRPKTIKVRLSAQSQ